MKTTLPKDPGADRAWYLVDAQDMPLGRLAVKIAGMLRGKNKVSFSPQVDQGDFVVVINASKVKLTGRKNESKIYQRFSGFRSGLKEIPASVMREKHADRMIKHAVEGMLPGNNLGRKMTRRLKVFVGGAHSHTAQNPVKVDVC
jgi:large subunit ribosomal protein L13